MIGLTVSGAGTLARAGAAILCATLFASAAAAEIQPGKPAPDFTGTDATGKQHTLSSLKGKVVVLEWINEGCPYVNKHYGTSNMQTLQKDATGQGVVWLAVASSAKGEQGHWTGPQASKWMADKKAVASAVLLDDEGKIGRLYDAKTTPHMYVIDKDGMLAYAGAIDDKPTASRDDVKGARNYVREALAAVAEGKSVSPSSTRAYGCTVKYSSPPKS